MCVCSPYSLKSLGGSQLVRLRDKLARTNFVNFTKSRTLGYLEPFFSSVTVGAMHFHITG